MRCESSSRPDGDVVRVFGEVDLATAPSLAEALAHCSSDRVIVDLAGVTFIDASGLNALVAAQRYLDRRGAVLHVHGASARVERLFEIAGLDLVFGRQVAALAR